MKRLGKVALAVALMAVATPALADMISVQTNLANGIQDSNYNAGTLTIAEGPLSGVTTTNATIGGTYPTGGDPVYTNTAFSLTTYFDQVISVSGTPWARFLGGSVSLTFDLGANSYELSGPINVLLARVTAANQFVSTIQAEGLFQSLIANMPEPWAVSGLSGLSSIDSLIFDIGEDLSSFNWNTGEWLGMAEATVQMVPNDGAIPEPATMALLALGGLAVLRRR